MNVRLIRERKKRLPYRHTKWCLGDKFVFKNAIYLANSNNAQFTQGDLSWSLTQHQLNGGELEEGKAEKFFLFFRTQSDGKSRALEKSSYALVLAPEEESFLQRGCLWRCCDESPAALSASRADLFIAVMTGGDGKYKIFIFCVSSFITSSGFVCWSQVKWRRKTHYFVLVSCFQLVTRAFLSLALGCAGVCKWRNSFYDKNFPLSLLKQHTFHSAKCKHSFPLALAEREKLMNFLWCWFYIICSLLHLRVRRSKQEEAREIRRWLFSAMECHDSISSDSRDDCETSEQEYFFNNFLIKRDDDDCDVVALDIGSNQLVTEKCISRAAADEVLNQPAPCFMQIGEMAVTVQWDSGSHRWQSSGEASPSIFILKPLNDVLLTSNWAGRNSFARVALSAP